MAKGGRRPGAGRKKGSLTKRSQEVRAEALAKGITPLEVMLDAMRRHHRAKRYNEAAAIAKDAAPFCHPRLTSVEHAGASGGAIQIVLDSADQAG